VKGYPSFLNSREDYDYVRTNFPKEVWLKDFQHLLEIMGGWYFVSELKKKSDGYEDSTHKIIEIPSHDDRITYAQYEFRINPECKLFRIGYTENEVKSIIESAGGKV